MAHRDTHEGLKVAVSRRQVMIGAAGLTFAFVLAPRAQAAVLAAESVGKALTPWVSEWPKWRTGAASWTAAVSASLI